MTASPEEFTDGAPAVEDRFALVGTVLEGKYAIEKVVAEGGFGLVYKGVQSALGRPVAIKVLKTPPELNAEAARDFQDKFKNEAKTIAQHGHPNIVQVIDFGVSAMPSREVAPWMALEWLKGKTLEDAILERRAPYTPREALALLRPVFEALAFVHEAGIAHRDLKPANIMIVESGRVRLPKLMDFGIAKLMDPNEQAGSGATRTRSTQNAFSPQYASPEQLSGTRSGPWTDVHAMGLILTEMLTGQPAFQADDMTQLFVQILGERRPTPAKFAVDVGPWEQVIHRAVSIKPDDRYKNAMDMLLALDESVPASAMGAVEQTGQRPAASPTTLRQSAVAIPLVNARATEAPGEKKRGWIPIALGALLLVGAASGFAAYKLGSHGGDGEGGVPSAPRSATAGALGTEQGPGQAQQTQQAQQAQQAPQALAVTTDAGAVAAPAEPSARAAAARAPSAVRASNPSAASQQSANSPLDPAATNPAVGPAARRNERRIERRNDRRLLRGGARVGGGSVGPVPVE
jgi:serine/threonine protein kinase